MSFSLTISPEAEQDLAEARDWYEEKRIGLGGEFLLAVDKAQNKCQEGDDRRARLPSPSWRWSLSSLPRSASPKRGCPEIDHRGFRHLR